MKQHPALAILDLFAKQIIHRPLGHAEFDATYATLRAELADAEPQIETEEDEYKGRMGSAMIGEDENVDDTTPLVATPVEIIPPAPISVTPPVTVEDLHVGWPEPKTAEQLAAPGELNLAT